MRHRTLSRRLLAACCAALLAGAAALAVTPGTGYTIVAWNNLGMHCMDADFEFFSILPPYNTIDAQVIDGSGHLVTSPAGLSVTYAAIADPSGSINTTSAGKTNFWDHVLDLLGASLGVDHGLAGKNMPGAGNVPQPMDWVSGLHTFHAEGIPITPKDDAQQRNPYPMMRIDARDGAGNLLATTRIVLPVSDEMDCTACHASFSNPAAMPAGGWVNDLPHPQRDYRLNILKRHDDRESTHLYDQVTLDHKPVLCAACHSSIALGTPGAPGVPALTSSMHAFHAPVVDPTNGFTLDASANRSACYRCHPGSTTRCLRGAMGSSVAADGTMAIQCQACHGSMSAVGDPLRTGWLMEPTCQQCHTGTATHNNGEIRYTSAFDGTTPRVAVDDTFATQNGAPAAPYSLYRFSAGHGGLQCEACHGSTHAEYPSSHASDNLQSLDLQGHVGTLGECASCHTAAPAIGLLGPHGMHPVGQVWVDTHGDFSEINGTASCAACHGADYNGTVLSRDFSFRNLTTPWGTKTTWRGFQIGCRMCHDGPTSEVGTTNHPPVAQNATASTMRDHSVAIPLAATDPDADALTFRVVSQPAHGTVGLAGTTATYFPENGWTGSESFTFAAWDGKTNSNRGTVTVAVAACGDANGDGRVNVSDVFWLINGLFAGGAPPAAPSDVNADGKLDVADVFYLINYLFAGGPAPK